MAFEGAEGLSRGAVGLSPSVQYSGQWIRKPRTEGYKRPRRREVGRTLNIKDFDLERIFGREGVQLIHLSDLSLRFLRKRGTFCLELARAAKKYGTLISFDLNYRASFWKGRESELSDVFKEIVSASDILIGNEEGLSALSWNQRSRSGRSGCCFQDRQL